MTRKDAVDLFCGAGGQTAGILSAARRLRQPLNVIAVNHWDTAINSHSLNHPTVRHICEPVENLMPCAVIPTRRLHLLAAGVECTYHSNARGGGPCNEQSRSQAWQLVRWATDIRVENILMENVREFLKWGPLHPMNKRPIKSRSGEYFNAFVTALRGLGYTVEWKIQCAADFGDATSRERLILMARRGQPIEWPKPTHGDPSQPGFKKSGLKPWRTAREIIDWTLKGESIFNRKKPLCENTLARIAAGLTKFGGPNAEPFLIILRGTSASQVRGSAHSLDAPLPTLTAGGGHMRLVQPHKSHRSNKSLEFILPPEGYYRGNTAKSLDEPLPTITASRGRAIQLVQGKLKPVETVRRAVRAGKASAFVIGQQSGAVARSVKHPLPTVATAGAIRLVQPFIMHATHHGHHAARCHSTKKPLPTVTGAHRGEMKLVQPFLYSAAHGEDKGKPPGHGRRVKSLDQPLPTVTCVKRFALCEPVLVQTDQTGSNGKCVHSTKKPLPTIVSKQNLRIVEAMIAPFYRTGVCKPVSEPLDTVTTRDRFMLVEFSSKVGTARRAVRAGKASAREKGHRRANDPTYRIVGELDILTRMLQPHELAAAHSLDKFKFQGTKEDQTKQIGNSVPKRLAEAHAWMLLK